MDKHDLADLIGGERSKVVDAVRNLVVVLDMVSVFPWWVRFLLKSIVALLTEVNQQMAGLCDHLRRGWGP